MKAVWGALWAAAVQLFLGMVGQPPPGQSSADRARKLRQARRVRTGTQRAGAVAALRTLAREALYAVTFQPSPEDRSASSRRKPRP